MEFHNNPPVVGEGKKLFKSSFPFQVSTFTFDCFFLVACKAVVVDVRVFEISKPRTRDCGCGCVSEDAILMVCGEDVGGGLVPVLAEDDVVKEEETLVILLECKNIFGGCCL